jgi:hypothetical protein
VFLSGHVEALRHIDRFVVDRFYHARHPLLTVNVGEDSVLVESRVRYPLSVVSYPSKLFKFVTPPEAPVWPMSIADEAATPFKVASAVLPLPHVEVSFCQFVCNGNGCSEWTSSACFICHANMMDRDVQTPVMLLRNFKTYQFMFDYKYLH